MRRLRVLMACASIPLLWLMLANCNGPSNAPPPCSGQFDCAIDEQCYNNMCVRVLPPLADGGTTTPDQSTPPVTCQAGQCNANGQCLQVSNATCGVNGSPCLDCSAQGGCNFGTGQCLGGTPPPPTCQANQCKANGQCILSSDAACGANGSACVDCSAQGGCNQATGQCNGGTNPTCGPSNCVGCCQNGQCVQASNAACGLRGSACTDCSAQGGCNFGTGQCNGGTNPNCNASNCLTCCQNGRCISPGEINDSACGARGVVCDNCSARGTTCNRPAGQCNGGTPTCGPTNCVGCCQNGQCVQASNAACGLNGSACTNCSAQGGCNFSTGQCNGGTNPTCGPSNCAGCCQNGQCVQPQQLSDIACGARGNACANCQSSSATCNKATGQCQGQTPNCSASNCPNGCCQNNSCIVAISDVACGNGGQACINCNAQGQTCDLTNRRCMAAPPSCGPATCGNGCCQNGQCVTNINDRACGGNGGTCQNCSSTQQCDLTQKICIQKPQNQYPPGPYGTSVGGIMSPNIAFTECANTSNGSTPSSTKAVFNSQVKVVLLTVHAGW